MVSLVAVKKIRTGEAREGRVEKADYVTMPAGVSSEPESVWMVNVNHFLSSDQSKSASSELYSQHTTKFDEIQVFDRMMNYVMQSNECPRTHECDGPY